MFLLFLDSRQGNAGMTDGALDSRLRGNDKIGSFIQLRKGLSFVMPEITCRTSIYSVMPEVFPD